jgi:hypothetical protein
LFEGTVFNFEDVFGEVQNESQTEAEAIQYIEMWAGWQDQPFRILSPDDLLDILNSLRFEKAQEFYRNNIVKYLIEQGVYPETTPHLENTRATHLSMIDNYGARWHEWAEPKECSRCSQDWRNHKTGPPFKEHVYGVEHHDMTVGFHCTNCGAETPHPGREDLFEEYAKEKWGTQ